MEAGQMDSGLLKHHQYLLNQQKQLKSLRDAELFSSGYSTEAHLSDKGKLQGILKSKELLQEEINKTFGDEGEKVALLSFSKKDPSLPQEKSGLVDRLLEEREKQYVEQRNQSLAHRRDLEKQKERLDAESDWLNSLSGGHSETFPDATSYMQNVIRGLPSQEEYFRRLQEKHKRDNERLKHAVTDTDGVVSYDPFQSPFSREAKHDQSHQSFMSYGGIAQLLMEEIVLEETHGQAEDVCKEILCLWDFIRFQCSSGFIKSAEAFVTDDLEGRPIDDPLHALSVKYFRQIQSHRQTHRKKIWAHTQPVSMDATNIPERKEQEEDKDDSDTIILDFYDITPSYLHHQKVRRKDAMDVKVQKERYHRYKKAEIDYWSRFSTEITSIIIPKKFQGISMVRFSRNNKFLAVGSGHGDLIVYDNNWEPWREFRVLANRGKKHDAVVDLSWSLDGTKLVVINKMGTLTMWSLTSVESGREDADLLGIKEDSVGIIPAQLVPLIVLDTDQRDFTFQRGPLVEIQDGGAKVSPLVASLASNLTLFGAQNNLYVGLSDGNIIQCETEKAAHSADNENFNLTAIINEQPNQEQEGHNVEHEIGQNIPAQLLKHHKSPLVLIDVIGGTGDLVSLDTRGRVLLWKNRIKEKTVHGWYRPYTKYRVDFSKKVYVPMEASKSNVIFGVQTLLGEGKTHNQIHVERQKAVKLIEDMRFGDPWHEEILPEEGLHREIYKPSGSISNAGAIFHVVQHWESSQILEAYFTRLFKPVMVNCSKFLCCVMSPSKTEIVFVLLFPEYERKEAHITVVILDLRIMRLRNVRVDIRVKDPELYLNQDVVSCDISRTLGTTGASYIFLNIKGNFYGISMETGQFILRTESSATPFSGFEGLKLNNQLVKITPESEVAAATINGSLTLLSYASGQKKSRDQRTMTVIKLKDGNSEQNRILMKGLFNFYGSSKFVHEREVRLEKTIYDQHDHIWADMCALVLSIMDKVVGAEGTSTSHNAETSQEYFRAGYQAAISQMSSKAGDKKAVQVVVRVRPQIFTEDNLWVEAVDSKTLQTLNHRNTDEALQYDFSNVFGPNVTQKDVYDACVKQLLNEALDGKNASVFAYGPTGAGKTHTILGTAQEPGVIPRAVKDVFCFTQKRKEELESEGALWDFDISFSYVEIYQEKVLDLLQSNQKDLPVREDGQKNIFVAGLTEEKINDVEEFNKLFGPASKNRTTAATRLNERSSRSHSILILKVRRRTTKPPHRILTGKFHIIDLAGSEDNRRTGNKGVRLKESGSINASLLALGQVVEALNRHAACVPYRGSRLTRLLQDSLGGTAATCMIVNLSPEERYYFDTYTTLHFARKTKKIVNTQKVNETCEPGIKKRKSSTEVSNADTSRSSVTEQSPVPSSPPPPVAVPLPSFSPFVRQQNTFNEKLLDRIASLENMLNDNSKSSSDGVGSGNDKLDELEKIKQDLSKVKKEVNEGQKRLKKGLKVYADGSCKENLVSVSASPLFLRPAVLRKRPGSSVASSKNNQDEPKEKLTKIDENASKSPVNAGAQEVHNKKILDLLNTGSIKELQMLQTVGQKRAQLIFDWRSLHGPFDGVTDLGNVVGISQKNMKGFIEKNMIQL